MIDIHAHILPGMDDGAADLQESLEMARLAVKSGVTAIVATPHCNVPGLYDNYRGREYAETFQRVEAAWRKEGLPLTLYAGMEVFVTSDICRLLEEKKLLTLNGSRYLLVEFEFGEEAQYVQSMLEKIEGAGLCPVIAHPERYEFVQDDLQLVSRWRKKGYLIQANKGSIMGRFGRRPYDTVHKLLKNQLVSVVASDAHSPYQRTTYLLDAYEKLLEKYPEKYVKMLFEENPMRICQNKPFAKENGYEIF